MQIVKTICQIRRDMEGVEIPVSVFLRKDVQASLEELLGATATQGDPDIDVSMLEALAREMPTRAAELKKSSRESIEIKNGCYTCKDEGSTDKPPIFVEELSIKPTSLYVRVLATTSECKIVLADVEKILIQSGVPDACFEDVVDDYATRTYVQLKGPIELLFSDAFRTHTLGAIHEAAKLDEETKVLIHPYNIEMRVHQWKTNVQSPAEARTKSWDFSISHENFDDHDKKQYKVYTRLDSEKHLSVLEALEKALDSQEEG